VPRSEWFVIGGRRTEDTWYVDGVSKRIYDVTSQRDECSIGGHMDKKI
jgi:hypothetical protein